MSRATAEENQQSKPATRYLTVFQRKLLQNRLENDLPERYRKRIHIMLLADEGKSQAEICKALGCCHATVRHWILIAQSGQAHTWLDRPMGRPKLIHDDYRNRLKELVEQSPRDYGYAFRRWTAGWLSKHLEKEFNLRVSDRHINRLLKQMGLSTRPRPSLKTESAPASRQSAYRVSDDSEHSVYSNKITIRDLQPGSPVTPINSDKQIDLKPSNKGANIYGAASVDGFPFFSSAQSSFWGYFFRYPAADVS
ncbi:MAG: helix-turn-helix domain-containing protein [Cyanobacteria bacterium P01_G01_bin.38]